MENGPVLPPHSAAACPAREPSRLGAAAIEKNGAAVRGSSPDSANSDILKGMAAAPEKARWYRLTPGRSLSLLLAVEGFLLLSEHFRWFGFNQHKGWTVLIAVASVGVFLLLMFFWFLAALVFRWRFQFSILSLLVLVVVVAMPFSWLATEMKAGEETAGGGGGDQKGGGRGKL